MPSWQKKLPARTHLKAQQTKLMFRSTREALHPVANDGHSRLQALADAAHPFETCSTERKEVNQGVNKKRALAPRAKPAITAYRKRYKKVAEEVSW